MKSTSTWGRRVKLPSSHRTRCPDQYVEVAGVKTRYLEEGQENAGPPLIMVHGYNGSCDYWYPQPIPTLAAERHVIAVDLPGNGLSAKMPAHTVESYAEFLVAFMDALGIERADLLGHSMGGQLAIAAAAKFPERFRKLVLVDSAGLPELVRNQWLAPIKMLTDSSLRQVSLYPTFVKTGLRARAAWEGLRLLRAQSIRRDLKLVQAPVLIVWGSRDRVVPLEHGAFMAKRIPNARLAILRGAGHMPFCEQPEQFGRLVLSFLRDGG